MAVALPTTDELARKLSEEIGWLQGSFEVAAHLESLGFSDHDAREAYGKRDVFELAEDVLRIQRTQPALHELAAAEELDRLRAEADRYPMPKLSFFRTIIRGAAYGMPMGITIFASLILLYSLWSYYFFTPTEATAIGLGTALSYFVSGGITQAIGRRGLMYLRQNMYLMVLKVGLFFVLVGLIGALALGAVMYLVFNVFAVIANFDSNLAIIYFVSLSVLWVTLALLYMLERELLFTVAIAFGVFVVYWLREYVGMDSVVLAHQIGIAATSLFSLAAAAVNLLWLHWRHRDQNEGQRSRLPRLVMLLSSVRTFLLFGSLYFTLLFVDRLLAWTGRMDFRQTFIWFRADYEAGLNWALLGMLPAFTVLEVVLQRFGRAMKPRQLAHDLKDRDRFSAWFMRFYLRQVVLYLVVSIVGVAVAWFGLRSLVPSIPELEVIGTFVTQFSFWFGVVGYLAVGFALLNLSVFFWLSRPKMALMALLPAIAADIVVGYLLTRIVSYHLAAVGLAVGGLLFALIATVLCLRVMSNLDYYYYSAF